MIHVPLHLLLLALFFFLFFSAFCSGSETAVMGINRYRLRHLARRKHRSAMRLSKLLERLDRLLSVILICNTFSNILISAVTTVIASRLFGDVGIMVATLILTLVLLICTEIAPKTIAASYSERYSFIASLPLLWLQRIFYPVVVLANGIVNGLFWLLRIKAKKGTLEPLSYEELRTLVYESGEAITRSHREMLLGILDLQNITVNDVMVPRNEIVGIDVHEPWSDVLKQIGLNRHAHVVVYNETIDDVRGILHLHKIFDLFAQQQLTKQSLLNAVDEIYFIPENTPVTTQLLNFQKRQVSIALVVDEYGDIQGLVSLEDILEEIVGKFASQAAPVEREFWPQDDGSFIVDGGVNIRDLNRELGWVLPTGGPKTLSGIIVEQLESFPRVGIGLKIAGYPMEIVKVEGNMVKTIKIMPQYRA